MNNKGNTITSLFASKESNSINNQENEIDTKLQRRQENFSNSENFSKIKEYTVENELSFGQNIRNKILLQKRLKQNLNLEKTQNLKNILTIPREIFDKCEKMDIQLSNFQEIISVFRTQEINQKYYGLVGIRKLLSTSPSPIQELIDIGIIPELISLLDNSPPEFQYEALWCLTNFAAGTKDQINCIVSKGVIPKIIKLMESSIEELKIQAIFILGNLVNDSKIRDLIIKEKGYDKLLTILVSTNNNALIKYCTWTLSCFFRIKPILPYSTIKKAINSIARSIVILPNDIEFLSDAFFILSFITEYYKEAIKDILELDLIKNSIKCLDINNEYIQLSCLRVIGNVASGNANQTQLLIDLDILKYFKKTLLNSKKAIRKETVWIISNIAAGTQKQIEYLISEDFLPILAQLLEKDEYEIKRECIWAICNLTSVEKTEFIQKILNQNILKIIYDCLKMDKYNAKYLAVCLEALGNLLAFGSSNSKGINPIVIEAEKIGLCDILEKLQFHPVEVVYDKTVKLLEEYFETQYME